MKTTTAVRKLLALSLGLLFTATTFAQTSQTAGSGPNTTLTAAQMQAQLAAAQAQVRQLNQEMSNTIAATQAWQAQQPKPTSAQNAAAAAAMAAADAAYFSNNVAPYAVRDLGISSDALKRRIATNLLILSSNLNSEHRICRISL